MFRRRGKRPTTFTGVPPSGTLEYVGFGENGSLYEFEASSGEHVYLHEFMCTRISYHPVSSSLVLTFEYPGSDQDMDASLDLGYRELVVTMTFEGARVLAWGDDRDESTSLPADVSSTVLGQVADLAETNGVVVLALLDVELTFTASRVSYKLR